MKIQTPNLKIQTLQESAIPCGVFAFVGDITNNDITIDGSHLFCRDNKEDLLEILTQELGELVEV